MKLCAILLPIIVSIAWFWVPLLYAMNLIEFYWFVIIGVIGTLVLILCDIFEIIKLYKINK